MAKSAPPPFDAVEPYSAAKNLAAFLNLPPNEVTVDQHLVETRIKSCKFSYAGKTYIVFGNGKVRIC